jgi:L-threonylcarbamoyladenylate synthase
MKATFENDVEKALAVLKKGGVILYPTDTIWGLGCDATNEAAVQKVYTLKKRPDSKSLIILLADSRDLLQYVAGPDPAVFEYIERQTRPTTIVFENAIHLPDNLIAADGSIAIRIVTDLFCRHLLKRMRKPLVSTSANISGAPSPQTFGAITAEIKTGVDYVVAWRQEETTPAQPSQLVKWNKDGTVTILRA